MSRWAVRSGAERSARGAGIVRESCQDGADAAAVLGIVTNLVAAALGGNPQIRWFDDRRGYTICEVTPERWHAEFRAVADPFDDASAVETISEWEITAGTPGAVQL